MKQSIAEKRNYKITTVSQVKDVILDYLNKYISDNNIKIGLPEINDRYNEWRTTLLNEYDFQLGSIVIDAYTGKINKDKTTDIALLKSRLHKKEDITISDNKKPYGISPLNNTIELGDSIKVLEEIPEESIDLIFTSPPYFNARPEYKEYEDYDEYLEIMRQIIRRASKTLVNGKFFVMNISHVLIPRQTRNHSSTRIAVPFDLHKIFIEEGFEFIDDIIWQKPEGAGWASGRGRRFSQDRNAMQYKTVPVTEYVLVYRKKSDRLIDWFIRKHPNQNLVEQSKIEDGYEKTNIWYISPARDKRHNAIFPLELAEKIIKYYSFKGDVVLDPFGGLGTTAKAALKTGRKFFIIEKERKYFEEMKKDIIKNYQDMIDSGEIIIRESIEYEIPFDRKKMLEDKLISLKIEIEKIKMKLNEIK